MDAWSIDLTHPFTSLACAVEPICRGRRAAILVDPAAPTVVRSTTSYQCPPLPMRQAHRDLITAIQSRHPQFTFNNLMVEEYTRQYRRMAFHSDLALDLVPGSAIAIYSCYDDTAVAPRIFVTRNKVTGETTGTPLTHGSVVLFDTRFNRSHTHKIVAPPGCTGSWLGVTLRHSVTPQGSLRLASEEERRYFLGLRGCENREVDFVWPRIDYTLSPSDTLAME